MAIGIIIGIVIAVVAIFCYAFGTFALDESNTLTGAVCIMLGIVLTIAFIIVPFSFHTVKTGEIAVVSRLGKIEYTKSAGTHYDTWFTKKYIKYDTKVRNLDVASMAYSSDAQTMDVAMTIQYQIKSDNVLDIAAQYGSIETLENRIVAIAIEKSKSVLSGHKAMDIIAKRASMSPAVEQAIMDAVGDEYFVNVTTVVLTNIDFSDSFELAVEEKMIAEQNKLKAEYENETRVNAAKAEAEAKLQAAMAEIDIAKAQAEAKKIAAEAEANANTIIENSITDKILDKIYADKWDGKLPNVVGSGEYVLPSNIMG